MGMVMLNAHELRVLLERPLRREVLGVEVVRDQLGLDADLRPEGKSGPLVRSLGSYRTYYERWSLTWESQALLRAVGVPIAAPSANRSTRLSPTRAES